MAKRLKKVFPNWSQLIHVWAQQTQPEGRCSNMYFDKEILYSYQTPIAKFIEIKRKKKKARRAVLVSNIKYSVTTSAQQGAVKSAVNGYEVISCYDIGEYRGRAPRQGDMHQHNRDDYVAQYNDNISKIKTVLSSYKLNSYISSNKSIIGQYRNYCKFFGIRFKPSLFKPLDSETLTKINARVKSYEDKCQARKEKANEERKGYVYKLCLEYLNTDNEDIHLPYDWHTFVSTEMQVAITTKLRENWRNGKGYTRFSTYGDDILMRVKGDNIETSQGAHFPISHGLKAFPLIKKCKEKGEEFHTNGHQVHLGHFKIDSIDSDGNVKAGCHFVKYEEIERIAKQLNAA